MIHIYTHICEVLKLLETESRLIEIRLWGRGVLLPRELLYNIVLIVKNIVLYTQNFVRRVDLMLCVFTTVKELN